MKTKPKRLLSTTSFLLRLNTAALVPTSHLLLRVAESGAVRHVPSVHGDFSSASCLLQFPFHQHGISTGQSKSLHGHSAASPPSLTLVYFTSVCFPNFLSFLTTQAPFYHSSHWLSPRHHHGSCGSSAVPCWQLETAGTSSVWHGAALASPPSLPASTWAPASCTLF